MDREKADILYDLLDDLFYDIKNEKIEEKIIDVQSFLNDNYLAISNIWCLKK